MISLVHVCDAFAGLGIVADEFLLGVDQLVEQFGAVRALGLVQPGLELVGRFLGLGHFAELQDQVVDPLGHRALGRGLLGQLERGHDLDELLFREGRSGL